MIRVDDKTIFDPIKFSFLNCQAEYRLAEKIPVESNAVVCKKNIKRLTVFVTNSCNLACPYCYERKKEPQIMSQPCAKKICEIFGEKLEGILYFGGEPLLQLASLKAIHEIFRSMLPNARYKIITNGLLLDDSVAEWLSLANIKDVGISWDGFGDTSRYGYNKQLSEIVLNKIIYFSLNTDLNISVRMTVNETSVEELNASIKVLVENGIPVLIEPAFDYVKMDISKHIHDVLIPFYGNLGSQISMLANYKNIEALLASGTYKYYGCSAGRHSLKINTDGSIYDCHRMLLNPNNYLGDIYKINSVDEIDNSSYYYYKCNLRSECAQCEYRFLCGGGCVYSHSLRNCDVKKAMLDAILKEIWRREKEKIGN